MGCHLLVDGQPGTKGIGPIGLTGTRTEGREGIIGGGGRGGGKKAGSDRMMRGRRKDEIGREETCGRKGKG